jgi:hypothetical protein
VVKGKPQVPYLPGMNLVGETNPMRTANIKTVDIRTANLAKPVLIAIAFGIGGAIADGNAASTLKMTCSGTLTNTRADGVTLGQCDLNFLSVKEMTEIENVCGTPGTIDTPAENQCRIRAIVSPDPSPAQSPASDHRKLFKVRELWSVDKR